MCSRLIGDALLVVAEILVGERSRIKTRRGEILYTEKIHEALSHDLFRLLRRSGSGSSIITRRSAASVKPESCLIVVVVKNKISQGRREAFAKRISRGIDIIAVCCC